MKVNVVSESVPVDLAKIIPCSCEEYYTYRGSLTTSPYTENVRWVVMKKPLCASFKFLEALRELECGNKNHNKDGHVHDNFRNIMPLNERVISRSFKDV